MLMESRFSLLTTPRQRGFVMHTMYCKQRPSTSILNLQISPSRGDTQQLFNLQPTLTQHQDLDSSGGFKASSRLRLLDQHEAKDRLEAYEDLPLFHTASFEALGPLSSSLLKIRIDPTTARMLSARICVLHKTASTLSTCFRRMPWGSHIWIGLR